MEKKKRIILEIDPALLEYFVPYYAAMNEKYGCTKKRVLTMLIKEAVKRDVLGLGDDAPKIMTKEERLKKQLADAKKAIQKLNTERVAGGKTTIFPLTDENCRRYVDGEELLEE
jgi:hypothetical protein